MFHKLITPPASEPVTLAEMRLHLGIMQTTDTSRDSIISGRIVSARQWAETYTRIAFIKQTWTGYAVDFTDDRIGLKTPLLGVNSIKYRDSDNQMQTLDPALYAVDLEEGGVMPAYNTQWPVVLPFLNSVQVEYLCGFGLAAAIPTDTVISGAYTAAASTTATDKWRLTVDDIIILNTAVGAGGVLAAALQTAVDAFAAAQSAFYTVTGSVAGANLKLSKLDGTEILIASSFTDTTGLLAAAGTTSGGVFATAGFTGVTAAAGAADVPEAIREAIKFIVGQWEVFQSSIEGVMRPFTIPNAAKQLLDNYVDMRSWF